MRFLSFLGRSSYATLSLSLGSSIISTSFYGLGFFSLIGIDFIGYFGSFLGIKFSNGT